VRRLLPDLAAALERAECQRCAGTPACS